jgi:hypothetical protein
MESKARVTVLGASFFTGAIDGQMQDSGTLHVQVELDPKQNGKGFRTEAFRCTNAELVKGVMRNPFPFVAEVELNMMATKGKTSNVVTKIVPVERAKVGA